ncbi:MAG: hypothetical protein ACFE89_07585 [Candidatus Hodarchaeota archaeon]
MAHFTQSPLIQQCSQSEPSKISPPAGLYSLFILRESGCPFYYRFYESDKNHPDPAILGGFFIALSLFAKEVTTGELETITTGPCRYTFHQLRQGLLVLCSAKNFNTLVLNKIAKRIAQLFVTKFNGRLLQPYSAASYTPALEKHLDQIFSEIKSKFHR